MIIDPVTMLKIAPIVMDLVGKYTGKEKAASIFNNILSLSTLGDVFKDPSTGLKIGEGTKGVGPLANADEYISGLTGSIADKTQQNFSGVLDMMIGSPVDDRSYQASLFDFNRGLLGLG